MDQKEINRIAKLVKPFPWVERTMRDDFAARALQGMIESAPTCNRTKINKRRWAQVAYEWADAMLAARKK